MDSNGVELCRLCFTTESSSISIFDDVNGNILGIVGKHIGEVNESDLLPKFICIICQEKVLSFNGFYCDVLAAQQNFLQNILKEENDSYEPIEFEAAFLEGGSSQIADGNEPIGNDEEQNYMDTGAVNADNFEQSDDDVDEFLNVFTDTATSEEVPRSKDGKLSKSLIREMIEQHFDHSCDYCTMEMKTLKQAVEHYNTDHNIADGYLKCCDMKFKFKSQVEYHIQWHLDPDIFKCEPCNRTFKTKRALEVHTVAHRRQTEFPCKMCSKVWPTFYRLKKHMKTHLGLRKCWLCSKKCKSIADLQEHMKNDHNSGGMDEQLNKLREYHNQTEVDQHQIINKYFDMTCDQCEDGKFTSLEEAQFHYHEKHSMTDGYIKCCGHRYTNKMLIRSHVLMHTNPELFRCVVCSKDMDTMHTFQRHMKYHQKKPLDCSHCDKVFLSKIGLDLHLLKKHNIEKTTSSRSHLAFIKENLNGVEDIESIRKLFDMNCEVCQCDLENLHHAKLHYMQNHGIVDGYIKCCNLKFRKVSQVNEHLLFHSNPNIFKCNICDASFPNKNQLHTHQIGHRAIDTNRYSCKVCNRAFETKTRLNLHERSHDTKPERNFKCDQCYWKFATEELRSEHMERIHRKVVQQSEICEHCGKAFAKRAQLIKHIAVTHNAEMANQRRVQCTMCEKWVSSKEELKRHMKRHTDQPMKCPYCDKMSPNRLALNCHVKGVHEYQAIFKCNLCDKTFKRAVALKDHVATHTGEKSYKCSFCPEEFTWRPNMYAHRKKAHPFEYNARLQEKQAATMDSGRRGKDEVEMETTGEKSNECSN